MGALDTEGLEKPRAFVVLEKGVDATGELGARIQVHVRGRVAAYKYPRCVAFVNELPLTTNGKVKRYLLRER